MNAKSDHFDKPSWSAKYEIWKAKAEQSEQWLVERWVKGDEEDRGLAERILDDLYRPKLIRLIRSALRCPTELAEDIAQQVIFELYKLMKVRGVDTSVASFLFGRARKRIIDQFRSRRVEEISIESNLLLAEKALTRSSYDEQTPDEIAAHKEAIQEERAFYNRFVEPHLVIASG